MIQVAFLKFKINYGKYVLEFQYTQEQVWHFPTPDCQYIEILGPVTL